MCRTERQNERAWDRRRQTVRNTHRKTDRGRETKTDTYTDTHIRRDRHRLFLSLWSVFISPVLTDLLAADITHFEPWNYLGFTFVCLYETDSDWNSLCYVILRLRDFKNTLSVWSSFFYNYKSYIQICIKLHIVLILFLKNHSSGNCLFFSKS